MMVDALGYTGYGSPQDQAARLAQSQMAEGASAAPIRSKWQGAARLAQAIQGGLSAGLQQRGALNSNANALKLAAAAAGGGGMMGGAMGGGAPSVDTNAVFGNLPEDTFDGSQGPPPQMGPPMPAMAPGNSSGGMPPGYMGGGGAPGSLPPNMTAQAGMPPGGVQVASNDPNFMPSFPSPSADKGQAANVNPVMQAAADGGFLQGGAISQPPQSGGAGGQLGQLEANIAQTESGGNYGAQGPVTKSGDHAYGKYQVMGANVPSWTAAEGSQETPSQFLNDPQMQEKVAGDRLGSAMAKYGPAGAAREWFTGSPTGQGSDVNGMTADKYAALATGGGNAFLHNSVAGPGAPSSPIGNPPSPEMQAASDGGFLQGGGQQDQQQGNPQGGAVPPQMMEGIKQIMLNPYASPEAKQMAESVMQRYIMPHPYTWQALPNSNTLQAFDQFGRPVPGMQMKGPDTLSMEDGPTDMMGQKSRGTFDKQTGQFTPLPMSGQPALGQPAPQGMPTPQGGPAPNIPPANPAWTPQGGQGQPAASAAAPGASKYPTQQQWDQGMAQRSQAIMANPTGMFAQVPPQMRQDVMSAAQAIVNGQQPAFTSGMGATKPIEVATMDLVRQLDPSYTTNRFDTLKQFADGTTTGSPGNQLSSGRTALMHLREAAEQNNNLSAGQSNIPILGPVFNAITNTGKQDYESAYEGAIGKANDELTRFYLGAPGTESEREGELRGTLSGNATPDVRRAALQELGTLVNGKVNSLQERFHSGAGGMPDYQLLTPADQANASYLANLGGRTGSGQGQPPAPNPNVGQGQPQPQGRAPNAAAVQMLKGNPGLASAFDAKYGPGSAARVMGQ